MQIDAPASRRSRLPIGSVLLRAAIAVAACSWLLPATKTHAEIYPSKPLRFVVPYPPGGSTDPIVRIVGQKLTEAWKQQVVIDHRAGAAGNIAGEIVAKAAADGYTLLLGTVGTICINPALYAKLPFDPVKDLAPVSLAVSGFYLLAVHPSFPANSVQELVALARVKPRSLNYASGGSGNPPHLAMELLKQMARIDLQHVPYKGTGPALNDVMGGHVPMLFGSAASLLPQQKAGRIKVLAMTGRQRSQSIPDIPTVAEAGYPGFEVDSWYGVLLPVRTPQAVVTALHEEIARVTRLSDVRSRFAALGLEPVGNSPREFAQIIKDDFARWGAVVKQADIRLE